MRCVRFLDLWLFADALRSAGSSFKKADLEILYTISRKTVVESLAFTIEKNIWTRDPSKRLFNMVLGETEQLIVMALQLKTRSDALVALEVAIFAIVETLILTGNLLTFYVIWKNRILWTMTNAFVISLAFSDLCLAVMSLPLCLAANVKSSWPFSDVWCQYQGYICIVVAVASIQNLMWMAVNRYYRVVKTQKYRSFFSAKSTKSVLAFIWILAAVSPAPYFCTGYNYVFVPAKFLCAPSVSRGGYMTTLLVTLNVAILSLIVTYCYYRVFTTVRRHKKNFQQSNSAHRISVEEIKVTRTLFALVVLFLLCWTPIFTIDLIDTIASDWMFPREVCVTYGFLAAFSSHVNPICYGVMNPIFRKAYLNVFAKLTCCIFTIERDTVVRPFKADNHETTSWEYFTKRKWKKQAKRWLCNL